MTKHQVMDLQRKIHHGIRAHTSVNRSSRQYRINLEIWQGKTNHADLLATTLKRYTAHDMEDNMQEGQMPRHTRHAKEASNAPDGH